MTRFAKTSHPIFVQGILQRSGTNYLNNLLLLHQDIRSPGLVWEDFFLAHADLLAAYVSATQSRWNDTWLVKSSGAFGVGFLEKRLGHALVAFMEDQHRFRVSQRDFPDTGEALVHLVTATPSARNLALFRKFFPDAALLIIVRDGRAVVESGVRSFGWDYEEAMRMWTAGARHIAECIEEAPGDRKPLVVKYEDLVASPKSEMSRILRYLCMDEARFDFDACETLGVMGSSEIRTAGGDLHWKSERKPKDFNPLARADEWTSRMRSRFKHIAGTAMSQLGYRIDSVPDAKWRNLLLDLMFGVESKVRDRAPILADSIRDGRNQWICRKR